MAETLGVSIGTVKSRLSRARSKVSKLIGRVVVMNNKQNPDWYRKKKKAQWRIVKMKKNLFLK